uniref:Uncharacterized protein n=1 Tax=Nelumbo nucifera TaxID=4432 RepID=A0A822ZZQ3_NELNU|nr:TPA_asm: hypothetical protein HUJ06_018233 [Nelumbo nucifera]
MGRSNCHISIIRKMEFSSMYWNFTQSSATLPPVKIKVSTEWDQWVTGVQCKACLVVQDQTSFFASLHTCPKHKILKPSHQFQAFLNFFFSYQKSLLNVGSG